MDSLKKKIKDLISKKLGIALVGILTVVLNQKLHLGIDDKSIVSLSGMIVTYVVSQGAVDIYKIKSLK